MCKADPLTPVLLSLGSSAEAVAGTLKAQDIKGVRNTVRQLNPIVRYAQVKLRLDDNCLDVIHGDGLPSYILRMTTPNGTEEQVAFPDHVRQFLDEFNAGAYPDLEI
jgi:hypothetical protein